MRDTRAEFEAASLVPPKPPVVLSVPAAASAAPTPPAHPSQADVLQAYIAEHKHGKPSAPAVHHEDVDLNGLQKALAEHRLALADCEADAQSAPHSDTLRRYHIDHLRMWEEQLHALVLSLPEDKGVALLAAGAPAVNRFIVDSGSGYNLGPHRTPTADADAAGATSELRAPPSIQHTQTAGGSTVTLDRQYFSQVLVREASGQLVLMQWPAHNVPV
jgi:hypothetical protein